MSNAATPRQAGTNHVGTARLANARAPISVSAGNAVEIAEATAAANRESEASGISKIPMDFDPIFVAIEIVGESIRGLRNTLFVKLSGDISRQIVSVLTPTMEERVKAESVDGEDPDIAGMVPGPQKQAWELMDVLTDDEKLAIEEAEEEAKKKLEKEVAGA